MQAALKSPVAQARNGVTEQLLFPIAYPTPAEPELLVEALRRDVQVLRLRARTHRRVDTDMVVGLADALGQLVELCAVRLLS